ncbi:uncharacterized protein LOC143526566 [Brachyhypopomus gauderio]|uniref:uncharacterized protein LOC143526566 n=1 Tax=Brachyhypopomus gauderio TaxID=698409 RepID=UPI0040413377
MATPSKRPRDDQDTLTGYIHSVSPFKFSVRNTQRFHAVLQSSRENFHNAVIYSPGKRREFLQAAQNGTAVCLRNIKICRNTSDVIVFHRTAITVTTVPFAPRTPLTPPKILLKQAMTLPAGTKVSFVEAIIIAIAPTTRTFTVRGSDREFRNCSIYDGTAKITLQLLEKLRPTIQMLHSYRFSDLSTRMFKGRIQLSATLSTEVDKIEALDVPDAADAAVELQLNSATGTIRALEIRATTQCLFCCSNQDTFDPTSNFHRCQSCKMLQKAQTYTQFLHGTVELDANNEWFTLMVSNSVFIAYFNAHNIQKPNLVNEMEEHFLTKKHFAVTFDNLFHVSDLCQIALSSDIAHSTHTARY